MSVLHLTRVARSECHMRPFHRAVALLAVSALVAIVAGACSPAPSPIPASTPDVAALRLVTEPPAQPLPPGAAWGCQGALVAPVRVTHADGAMVFINVETGRPVDLVWPRGFGARLIDGRAQLFGPDGRVIASEGDVLDSLGGGLGVAGEAFHVCSIGSEVFTPIP
jgi:hypothetical protein